MIHTFWTKDTSKHICDAHIIQNMKKQECNTFRTPIAVKNATGMSTLQMSQ